MSRTSTIALAVLAAALVLPAAAAAKGASKASILGPKLKGTVVIPGDSERGGTPLAKIAEASAMPSAVFGQDPAHPMRASAPKGDLGPRYTISYVMPGPDRTSSIIRQDVYPYAKAGAVAYVKPNQVFWTSYKTHGGWYVGGTALKQSLIGIGLPATAPGGGGLSLPTGLLAGIAAAGAALILLLAAVRLRVGRRPEPATTA